MEEVRFYKPRDVGRPSYKKYAGTSSRKRHVAGLDCFVGTRYRFVRLGDGWALVDGMSDEEGYVFGTGPRRLHASRILLDTQNARAAKKLRKLAEELETEWQNLLTQLGKSA